MARILRVGALCLALASAGCGRTPIDGVGASVPVGSPSGAHPRQPYFTPGSESYGYYEGSSVSNACALDQDCIVTGCVRSTCAAEMMEIPDREFCEGRTTASWPLPQFASCGCLSGECRWYFENDYDRHCDVDTDCAGLGPPPGGSHIKALWRCAGGTCQFSYP